MREGRQGYADPQHPFQYQGSADLNTYKMFLEAGYALLREGGRLGLLVPSGNLFGQRHRRSAEALPERFALEPPLRLPE